MNNIQALLSLCTLVACMVLCDDVYTRKAVCTETSLPIKEKGVEFSCHVLTGGGTDHLIWRAHRQSAYLVFSCKIFTSYSSHFKSRSDRIHMLNTVLPYYTYACCCCQCHLILK